jgi:hypothetical protein
MLENTLGTIKHVREYLRDNHKCYRIPKGHSKMLENTKGKIKNVKEYLRDNQKCWRIPKGSQMDNAEKLET